MGSAGMIPNKTGRFFKWVGKSCSVTKGIHYAEYEGMRVRNDSGNLMKMFENARWVEVSQSPNKTNSIKNEVTKMLTIKNVILINGIDSDEVTIDQLFAHLKGEESSIDKMSTIKTNSKAVKNRVASHTHNIKRLVEILDAKEDV